MNRLYISEIQELDMTSDDPDKILAASVIKPVTETRTIFLQQLLVNQTISLFQYTDENYKVHYFYSKGNEKPIELIHHYLFSETLQRIEEDAKFRTQLSELASECADLSKETGNLKYREQPIRQFIINYIKCINPSSPIVSGKSEKLPLQFGILAGIMHSSYNFVGDINIASNKYRNYTAPVVGFLVDLGLSHSYDKLHFINELIYKRNKTYNASSGRTTTGFDYVWGASFDFSYLQLNSILRYNFGKSSTIKPFFDAGIGNAFIVKESKNTMYTTYATGTQQSGEGIYGVRKYEFSLMAGAGISIKKISIELRHGYAPKSFSSYSNLDIRTNATQILASYRF